MVINHHSHRSFWDCWMSQSQLNVPLHWVRWKQQSSDLHSVLCFSELDRSNTLATGNWVLECPGADIRASECYSAPAALIQLGPASLHWRLGRLMPVALLSIWIEDLRLGVCETPINQGYWSYKPT